MARAALSADVVITGSDAAAQAIESHIGVAGDRITRHPARHQRSAAARRSLGIAGTRSDRPGRRGRAQHGQPSPAQELRGAYPRAGRHRAGAPPAARHHGRARTTIRSPARRTARARSDGCSPSGVGERRAARVPVRGRGPVRVPVARRRVRTSGHRRDAARLRRARQRRARPPRSRRDRGALRGRDVAASARRRDRRRRSRTPRTRRVARPGSRGRRGFTWEKSAADGTACVLPRRARGGARRG